MSEPCDGDEPVGPDDGSRRVFARPEPDETDEEFSERFLAELLGERRAGGPSDTDANCAEPPRTSSL